MTVGRSAPAAAPLAHEQLDAAVGDGAFAAVGHHTATRLERAALGPAPHVGQVVVEPEGVVVGDDEQLLELGADVAEPEVRLDRPQPGHRRVVGRACVPFHSGDQPCRRATASVRNRARRLRGPKRKTARWSMRRGRAGSFHTWWAITPNG